MMVLDTTRGCVRGRRYYPRTPREFTTEEKQEIVNVLTKAMEEKEKSNALSHPVKRGRLRFLIGLPRSGKSTWATRWMRSQDYRRDESGLIVPRAVVCADELRLAIAGCRYNGFAEPIVWATKDYMVEALLARGHDVLVDGTHTQKSSIIRNIEADRDASWTLINTPVEVCKERAMESGQSDLLPVLDRMNRQLQELLEKGIDNVVREIRDEVSSRSPKRIAVK